MLSESKAIYRTQAGRECEVCRLFESDLHRDFLELVKLFMSAGLGNASGSRPVELGLAHNMLGLEFGVASSVKR